MWVEISLLILLVPVISSTQVQPPGIYFLALIWCILGLLWKYMPITAVVTSSLGDRAACLGEDVTFTCSVARTGTLIWTIGSDNNVILFSLSTTSAACPLNSNCSDSTGQFTAYLTDYSRDDEYPILGNLTSTLGVRIRPSLPDSVIITCSNTFNSSSPSNLSVTGSYSYGVIIKHECLEDM